MDNILSQEEVDALLKGISSGDVPTEGDKPAGAKTLQPYDLTQTNRVVSGKIPAVEVLTDRFTRHFRGSLTAILRRMVEVSIVSSEIKEFNDFIKVIPVPTSIHLLRIQPLRGTAILVLEASLVYTLIEIFTGGSGQGRLKIEGREFTSIENNLIRKVVEQARVNLEQAWNVLQPVQIKLERSEMHPQFAAVLDPSEVVLCVHLEVEIEGATGAMLITLPYSLLEPLRNTLPGGETEENGWETPWAGQISAHLERIPVSVSVALGERHMTVHEILELNVGDTLHLGHPVGEPLRVMVEGVPKYLALAGHKNGNTAVKISGEIQ